MAKKPIYKVIFFNQGKIYEIYARSVGQGSLFGFVEVEELLFGERSTVVVDPSEESLRNEFRGVRRTYIPLHSVVRVDLVEKQGTGRVTEGAKGEANLMPFPTPMFDKSGGDPPES